MNANLFDILARGITDPDKVAIETASGERISYADLVARTGRVANALTVLGLKPGDRVAAQIEKSVEAIVLYLATVRAGGVFLPLNTGYTPAEIEYFLGDAEPAVFVCDPARYESLKPVATAAGARVLTLDADGGGSLTEAASRESDAFETVERVGRRPGRVALHLRHHRALEGRDADPRQSRVERRGAARDLARTRPTTC